MLSQIELLQRKLERERLARKQAENILESKALELYNANSSLQVLNESLEQQVKKRTEELKKSEEIAIKAQQAEKLFLANMSHEIRTPLNAIIGMSFLMADTNLDPVQKEYMDIFQNSAVILKNLVSDILDISKIDSGTIEVHKKSLDIRQLSEMIISTFQKKDSLKDIEVRLIFDEDIKHEIFGDKQILNHILINLISNAYKFTTKGKVELSISRIHEDQEFYTLGFNVEDTGIGMTEEEIKKIFLKFTQANPSISNEYGGTGLGLTLAKRFIEVLGGTLGVTSTKDKGSNFYFELKMKKSIQIDNTKDSHKTQISYSWPGKKVLVVEDNLMNQKYIGTLLKKWKIDFDFANNGAEGVDAFQHNAYDLIFMDLSMPVMDGFEASQNIREVESADVKVPIIALTASTFSSKRKLALEIGMTDFLAKPFTPDQLATLITSYFKDGQIESEIQENFQFTDKLDFKTLNQTYQNDLEYAYDMFKIFDDIIHDEVQQLNHFHESHEYHDLRKLAHKIKPTFSMVGLSNLSLVMGKIESSALENQDLKITDLMAEFNKLIIPSLELVKLEKQRLWSQLNKKS